MPNNISLTEAIAMTSRYRAQRTNILKSQYAEDNILLTCETFDRDAFSELLDATDCEKVRIYFGMTEELQVRAIVVGVNSYDEDILPVSTATVTNMIIEEGLPCPASCPPPSPLNED